MAGKIHEEAARQMRPDKAKVVDEVWDDTRIDEYLTKQAMGGESVAFSLLLNAYRSMRPADFERFIPKFIAQGFEISARDAQGRTLREIIDGHVKADAFKDILTRYG